MPEISNKNYENNKNEVSNKEAEKYFDTWELTPEEYRESEKFEEAIKENFMKRALEDMQKKENDDEDDYELELEL